MIEPTTSLQRFAALDAWRGLCALGVVLVHVPVAHGFHASSWFSNLRLLVDFFFVLSGFVICHAYSRRIHDGVDATGFMIRRFGRLYPLHFAVLTGFVAFEVIKAVALSVMQLSLDGVPFTQDHSVPSLVSNLLLLQAFNLHGQATWNFPAWSIGAEFYTYIVFAVAVMLGGVRVGTFVIVAIAGAAGVAMFADDWMFTTHAFGFARCLYGFFVGAALYQVMAAGLSLERLGGTVGEVAAIAVLVFYLLATGENASSLAAPLVFAGLVFVFAQERGVISTLLLSAPAQALGLWSYSIYMVHMLVFVGLKIVLTYLAKFPALGLTVGAMVPMKQWTLGTLPANVALVVVHVAVVVIIARFTYHWVEAPARVWFSRIAVAYERRQRDGQHVRVQSS
jgi:peptidoglycan/LPS O-acetylase OafA/YrhL